MAIIDYATLKTDVALYHKRGTTLDSVVDTFIDNAETFMSRRLRAYDAELSTTITSNSSGDAPLPSDISRIVSVRRLGAPNIELEPVSVAGENRLSPFDTASVPYFYSVSGTTMRVTPIESSGSFVVTYKGQLPAISASCTTNWLITDHPDAYLKATLAEVFNYTREFNLATAHKADAIGIIEDINVESDLTKYGNAGIVLDGVATDDGPRSRR